MKALINKLAQYKPMTQIKHEILLGKAVEHTYERVNKEIVRKDALITKLIESENQLIEDQKNQRKLAKKQTILSALIGSAFGCLFTLLFNFLH